MARAIFGRGFYCPSGKKRAYYAVLAHVRPFLVLSGNLSKGSNRQKKISFCLEKVQKRGRGSCLNPTFLRNLLLLFKNPSSVDY